VWLLYDELGKFVHINALSMASTITWNPPCFGEASGNSQSNSASNTATVHISNGAHHNSDNKSGRSGSDNNHKSGGKISHSGNVDQSITQSNDIQASNSGTGGSAFADFNTQSNSASNNADVHISNGGHKNNDKTWLGGSDNGGGISHSGNVEQSIDQSNSITASNSGSSDGCGISCGPGTGTALQIIIPGADASFNTQSNDASNSASVDISNSGHGILSHSGNVKQSISQSNSINATSTSPSGSGGGIGGCGGVGFGPS
jgi:hypothetical protein